MRCFLVSRCVLLKNDIEVKDETHFYLLDFGFRHTLNIISSELKTNTKDI